VAPFDNYIVTMDMTGADIKTLLAGKSQYGEYASLKQYGLEVTYEGGEYEANGPVKSVKLGGQDLVDTQTYHIACNTFLSPGPGDSMDFSAGKNAKNINVINRNAVLYALLDRSATLDTLAPSAGTLGTAFRSGNFTYTLNVGQDVTALTFTAKPYDAAATVVVTGGTDLKPGANTVTITVTAPYENPYTTPGTVSHSYTVTVNRGFTDVAVIPAWAAESVAAMGLGGYFKGNHKGAFAGEQLVDHSMISTVLARMGSAKGDETGTFDATVPAWAVPGAAWCVSKGICSGDSAHF
ncbi:MAG: 5'-nucleotidase C-terminal domain-containing protein, partial [Pseudoflavonifractor sp.]